MVEGCGDEKLPWEMGNGREMSCPFYKIYALCGGPIVIRVSTNALSLEHVTWYFV